MNITLMMWSTLLPATAAHKVPGNITDEVNLNNIYFMNLQILSVYVYGQINVVFL